MSLNVPVVETDRLVLRGPEARDADGYVAFMTSDRAQYIGGPHSARQADWLFHGEAGFWALNGRGSWAVEEKSSGACVGFVGLWQPRTFPELELGWLLWPEAEGRGIGFEAARAARAHAYGAMGVGGLVSYIDPQNARSRALAVKLGAVEDPQAARPDPDDIVYRHPGPEECS